MRNTALILLTGIAMLTGCQSAPQHPTTAPIQTSAPQQQKSVTADPSQLDCKAISDPAQAEDCRFRKEVDADKKKHNSNYVVKHDPGSIKQP
jgi:uncharacterized lipoprotein YajG